MSARTKAARVVVDHAPHCAAVEAFASGQWASPWSSYPSDAGAYFGNAHGVRTRQGARHVWLRFRCNDGACPAQLIVNGEWVVNGAQKALREAADAV